MPRVSYNGLVADVREEDLEAAIAHLSTCPRAERKAILASVKKALGRAVRLMETGSPFPEALLRDTANDIGLWFAGEVLAGRAEQYRVNMQ
ncbi:MAG: hypothetical protein J0L97_05720 [Alphaproteobacteria bacterium]|nr:hypothetical protein [Alphaproteobacteria bacterium]